MWYFDVGRLGKLYIIIIITVYTDSLVRIRIFKENILLISNYEVTNWHNISKTCHSN